MGQVEMRPLKIQEQRCQANFQVLTTQSNEAGTQIQIFLNYVLH